MIEHAHEVADLAGRAAPQIQGGERGSSIHLRPKKFVAPSPPDTSTDAGGVEEVHETGRRNGPARFRDPYTAALGVLASEWESQHRTYQASTLRAIHVSDDALRAVIEESAAGSLALRDAIGKRMAVVLKKHPLYEWMAEHRGFPKAAHTARLISAIGDPLRFPGRVCTERHHLPSDFEGDTCPVVTHGDGGAEVCGATVGPVRRGIGTRSLWHYCGLHVVDGKFPKQRKGHQGTWRPEVRGLLLMPDVGIAAQLIRQRVEPWRGVYDAAKERISRERGVVPGSENEETPGPSSRLQDSGEAKADGLLASDRSRGLASPNGNGGGVDIPCAAERVTGSAATTSAEGVAKGSEIANAAGPLRPIQVEARARIIAVKAMVGDLLAKWKRLTEGGGE